MFTKVKKGHSLRNRKIRFEPLEERQLLAADICCHDSVFNDSATFTADTAAVSSPVPESADITETALIPAEIVEETLPSETEKLPVTTVLTREEYYGVSGLMTGSFQDFQYSNILGQNTDYYGNILSLEETDNTSSSYVSHAPILVFQDDAATATVYISVCCVSSSSVFGEDREDYWTLVSSEISGQYWRWALPEGVSNADALRDFTFSAYAGCGGDEYSIEVHIGYAEIWGWADQPVPGTNTLYGQDINFPNDPNRQVVGHGSWEIIVDSGSTLT
jgi:hypothetical protein